MSLHLTYPQADERCHLHAIYAILLTRAFRGGHSFDHGFMSAGEALGRGLDHFDAIDWVGASIVLRRPAPEILRLIETAPLTDLPLLEDALSVLLSFLGQSRVPKLTAPDQPAYFDPVATRLLQDMGLLDPNCLPQPPFWLILINHYSLVPHQGEWAPKIRDLLRDIRQRTWADAPQEFKDVVSGKTARPLTWAEGYLERDWRYGWWLQPHQLDRAIRQHHSALPSIVVRTLANPDHGVFVPPGYLPKRLN